MLLAVNCHSDFIGRFVDEAFVDQTYLLLCPPEGLEKGLAKAGKEN